VGVKIPAETRDGREVGGIWSRFGEERRDAVRKARCKADSPFEKREGKTSWNDKLR
jgi:hypothetical protein